MKKFFENRLWSLCALFLLFGFKAFAQTGAVEVCVISTNYLPGNRSVPSDLQQIYTDFNVTGADQKYPLAAQINHPLAADILRAYNFSCSCDPDDLLSAL